MIDYGRCRSGSALAVAVSIVAGLYPVRARRPGSSRWRRSDWAEPAGRRCRCRHRHFLDGRNQWSYSRHRCLHRTHHTGGSAVGRRSPHPKRAATHEPPCDLLRGWTRSRQSNSGGRPVGSPSRRRPTRSSRRCSTPRRARPITERFVRGGSSFSKVRPRRSSARCSPVPTPSGAARKVSRSWPRSSRRNERSWDAAPMVVIVAALPVSGSIPTIEQVSATAAATQNLLLAATARPRIDVAHRRPVLRPNCEDGARLA